MKDKKWIDISQPLHKKTAHWPGDTPFSYETIYRKKDTGSVNIGKMTMSLHSGTHIDAPFHFLDDGDTVTELDVNRCIGPCLLIDVSNRDEMGVEVIQQQDYTGVDKVLFKTAAWKDRTVFPAKIPVLSLEAIDYLHDKGITLIGVDLPSVDHIDSKELPRHHRIHQYGMYILENVVLDNVSPGKYELIALPLPIEQADGSPVRAVITPLSTAKGME